MIDKIILLFLLTFVPFLELRFTIPLGILSGRVELPFNWGLEGFGLDWKLVFIVCVIANAIVGILFYYLLDKFLHKFLLKYRIFSRLYTRIVERTQKKIEPYVKKYGVLGVAIFIGVPLPMTGAYSGALGSYLLGLKFRKFMLANFLGVLIAGIIVTVFVLTGKGLFSLF